MVRYSYLIEDKSIFGFHFIWLIYMHNSSGRAPTCNQVSSILRMRVALSSCNTRIEWVLYKKCCKLKFTYFVIPLFHILGFTASHIIGKIHIMWIPWKFSPAKLLVYIHTVYASLYCNKCSLEGCLTWQAFYGFSIINIGWNDKTNGCNLQTGYKTKLLKHEGAGH